MLIINVACADFFNATFGILMPLTSSIHRQWIFGDLGCNFYAFVTTVVGITKFNFPPSERYLVVDLK